MMMKSKMFSMNYYYKFILRFLIYIVYYKIIKFKNYNN